MLAVSSRFLASLREPHTILVRARLYRPSAPTTAIDVRVIGGDLRADTDARVRRQASLTVAFSLEYPGVPELVRELPFGGQATVERGIQYADGTTELAQLGRFRIDALTWDETERQATLTLSDRMAQVQDEPFLTPWAPVGMKPSDAAVAAVQEVYGGTIAYHVLTSPASEPALTEGTVYDQDRAQAVGDLASGVGAEAIFDNLGDFVLRPRPDGAGLPVWRVDAGDQGVLIGAQESLDRSSVRNGVAVRAQGEPDQPPIFALAVDDDPASPTRWAGPFGKVALISTLTSVSSQAQADATARSLLNLRLGLNRTLAIRGVPNPALEPGDLIEVAYADGREEEQLVNSLALGLGVEGTLDLGTKASYRPAALQPRRIRLYAGDLAWRELEDARVEEAVA